MMFIVNESWIAPFWGGVPDFPATCCQKSTFEMEKVRVLLPAASLIGGTPPKGLATQVKHREEPC